MADKTFKRKKKRNYLALDLLTNKVYREKSVKSKKLYNRKQKHKGNQDD